MVTNDVLFRQAAMDLQDVVTCIRHNVTIDTIGDRQSVTPIGTSSRPRRCTVSSNPLIPEALAEPCRSQPAAASISTSWPINIPRNATITALTPQETLAKLTWKSATERYPEGVPDSTACRAST